jgi:glycolate oxidase iron-sulfur subunit
VESAARLLEEADRCVKCGLCLPACPTYRLAALEAESPRGRIALIQGLLQGGLAPAPGLERHLDNCLGCRACEAACPSGVRYGVLIDGVRTGLQRPRSIGRRALLALASRPRWFAAASALARGLGWRRLAGWLPGPPGRWLGLVPPAAGPEPQSLARRPAGAARGRVGLFLGCVAREADGAVHDATARVLAALGYEVFCPEGQGCCGAMHLHAGLAEEAGRLADANRRAFAGLGLEAVVVSATGCVAVLREPASGLLGPGGDGRSRQGALAGNAGGRPAHPAGGGARHQPPEPDDRHLIASATDDASGLPRTDRETNAQVAPVSDVLSFLARADWSGLAARPLHARVAIHMPCSARDARLAVGDVEALLGRIPGLETAPLDPAIGCCGAAGTYLLHHAGTADALREDVLAAISASRAEVVVTANTGCAMHLRAGLAARGLTVRVAHPVELLAEAFVEPPSGEVRSAHPTTGYRSE